MSNFQKLLRLHCVHPTSKSVLAKSPSLEIRRVLSTTSGVMSKLQLADRFKGKESNVWVEFMELNLKYKPLNLGQGLPEDLVPDYVLDTLAEVCKDKDKVGMHQYTRGFGHPRLIKAISNLYTKILDIGHTVDPNKEILVTDGAYEALYTAIMGNVNPGDEVIIIEPFFDCYEPMVRLAGGTPRFISLKPSKSTGVVSSADWKLDQTELENLFNDKTKAIIVNNPNNPLGKVFNRSELDHICNLAKKHDVLVIADDVYEHMVFDGEMIRIATLPDMWDRTITIGSAGKTFSVTGWKLGWAFGPENLIRNCQVCHQNAIYVCPTPLQEAVARAFELETARLDQPECYFNSISRDLERKRDNLVSTMVEVGMVPVIPEGGYFILADWSPLADKIDLSTESDSYADYRFVKWLSKNRKLQGIPPSAFFSQDHKSIAENYIRFCFIKTDEKLNEAKNILSKWRKELDQ